MNTPFYKFSGFWLAVAMGLLMLVNFVRTWRDPAGFSTYMGLPIRDAADLAWVQVYGLRALFIGLVVAFLLVRLDPASLKWLAALAIVMALGDAWLASGHGHGGTTRHLITAGVLMVAAGMLRRWDLAISTTGTREP